MKCPKCKKNLQTKRTIATQDFVTRERYCGKCKNVHITIELFKDNYEKELDGAKEKMLNAEEKIEKTEDKYSRLTEAIRTIIKSGSGK